MRLALVTGIGLIAAALPAAVLAQNAATTTTVTTDDGRVLTLTAEQQVIFDSWTAERQATYNGWPYEYRVYYWTLPGDQQTGYWAMTPDQRGMIYKMSPDQRAAAWAAIMAQANGQPAPMPQNQANPPGEGIPTTGVPNPVVAEQPVPPAMPADPSYQGGAYKGALTPPPADAMNKSYPVCTRRLQDSCRNPGGR